MHILGLPTDIFNVYPASIKYKTYQARWQIGDIYVSGDARKTEDNPQGLGCYLVMTGRGCDDIFRILDSRNSSKLTAHLQRIDRTDLIPYIQYDTKHGKGGI